MKKGALLLLLLLFIFCLACKCEEVKQPDVSPLAGSTEQMTTIPEQTNDLNSKDSLQPVRTPPKGTEIILSDATVPQETGAWTSNRAEAQSEAERPVIEPSIVPAETVPANENEPTTDIPISAEPSPTTAPITETVSTATTVPGPTGCQHDWICVRHEEEGHWIAGIVCDCGWTVYGDPSALLALWNAHSESFPPEESLFEHGGCGCVDEWVVDVLAWEEWYCSLCGEAKP